MRTRILLFASGLILANQLLANNSAPRLLEATNEPAVAVLPSKGLNKPIFTITANPSRSLNVVWLCSSQTKPTLQYKAAGTFQMHGPKVVQTPLTPDGHIQACKVTIETLKPSTTYEFHLGNAKYKVRTLPENRPQNINFVVGGDIMHTPALMEAGVATLASRNPDFALLGGDFAYANGQKWERWLDWFEIWANEAVSSYGLSIPTVICIGNHEVIGGYGKTPEEAPFFYKLFPFPEEKTAHYTLDFYEDMSLIILDSDHTKPIAEQTDWLATELEIRKDRKHLFALYHFPAYGIMKRGIENKRSKEIRLQWTPLFDQYNLDAAFENDHHIYKRSKLIRNEEQDTSGTLYIGDGAMGVHTREIPKKEFWYIESAHSVNHIIDVSIKGDTRHYRAINHQLETFDYFKDTRDQANP